MTRKFLKTHQISPAQLTLSQLEQIINTDTRLMLSDKSFELVQKCRKFLDDKLENTDELLYGINTGFGALCNVRIAADNLRQLQYNLIRSHACGVGDVVPAEIVKIMLFLKIQSLSYGNSGVTVGTIERLIEFYNRNLLPVVFTQGSLGASGDLAPLAHLCLPLIGEGEFLTENGRESASSVLDHEDLLPLNLEAKEGLALLNGTQFMLAYAIWGIFKAKELLSIADLTTAIGIDAWQCRLEPFLPYIHDIRPHKGQKQTAASILKWLESSELSRQPKTQVQDPYSFRCVPQVHGASKDVLAFIIRTIETELNSVTDNPNIFAEDELILSGGNFHGQPLAFALDFLAIAMAEIGNISERRTFNLLSGERGLPEFLVAEPGINSGLMIPQYVASALVSENKQLCTPASVDSITSSNGQEDHVSMGANAAIKLFRVLNNLTQILSIEWLTATQGLYFRRPMRSSPQIEKIVAEYRKSVSFMMTDRFLQHDILATADFLKNLQLTD